MSSEQVENLADLSLAKHHFNPGQRKTLDDYKDMEELSLKK